MLSWGWGLVDEGRMDGKEEEVNCRDNKPTPDTAPWTAWAAPWAAPVTLPAMWLASAAASLSITPLSCTACTAYSLAKLLKFKTAAAHDSHLGLYA